MTTKCGQNACSNEKRAKIKASRTLTSIRRKSQVVKSYECKIVEKRLNSRQREQLKMLFVEGKWFYNHVLNQRKGGTPLNKINSTHIKTVEKFDKYKKKETVELRYISAAQKQALVSRMISNEISIASLVKKGYQRHGELRFKSELDCIPLKQYGQTYNFKSFNKVKIQGISGKVLLRTGGQLQAADELANANLVKKPDGYYLKVTAFINRENYKEKPRNGKEIGLDFGVKTSITTSEGEKFTMSVEEGERLKRLQRELSRRQKGSRNRQKTINLIRREYQKMDNQKHELANKFVSKMKRYECVAIQDEQIAGWQKGLFGRQVQHSCMGLVKAKLRMLPQTVILDKWIPTTKWCPKCGRKHSMSLDKRVYACDCGYSEDRDVHSAKNMLAIKDMVFSTFNLVPTEHREITLMEFKASVNGAGSANGKPGRRSEKMPRFQRGVEFTFRPS